jgi:hypothetical protein
MNRPASNPDWIVSFSARWFLVTAAMLPIGFIAWVSFLSYRDVPFWDEFGTTLGFLTRLHDSSSWRETLGLFLAADQHHCMVTSRLIFAGSYLLTGQINFIALAAIGNLAILGAILVLAAQPRDWNLKLVYAALLCLLIFQLQHFENQLLSYAAIDHYQVVWWAAVSLAALQRRGAVWVALAGLAATAGTFTLAHGLAVFPAGVVLLALGRRWRGLAVWAAWAVAAGILFFWLAKPVAPSGESLGSVAGLWAVVRYWLTLLGSVPGLEHPDLSPLLGLLGLGVAAGLASREGWRREPVLGAFLVFVLGATLLMAYGRFTLAAPQIASRYFVQSALFWATLLTILAEVAVPKHRFLQWALPVTLYVSAFNVVASTRYLPVAEDFFRRRLETIRYYDKGLTLGGAPYPIYPDHTQADQILNTALEKGIYRLQARTSLPIARRVPSEEQAMAYYLDEVVLADRRLHVRGWMLPNEKGQEDLQPYLVLKTADREFVFRGRQQRRPDVAKEFNRPDALNSGFVFVVRRMEIPPTELRVSLEYRTAKGGVFTNTDHRVANQENYEEATLANIHSSLTKPARQIFLGVLPEKPGAQAP